MVPVTSYMRVKAENEEDKTGSRSSRKYNSKNSRGVNKRIREGKWNDYWTWRMKLNSKMFHWKIPEKSNGRHKK